MIHRIAYCNSITGSFDDCLSDCLENLHRQAALNTLLGVVFFIDADQPESFQQAHQAIAAAIEKKGILIPFNVLAQAGCCPVSIEIWLDNSSFKAEYLTHEGVRYTRFYGETGVSIWGMGLRHRDLNASIQEQADKTFRLLVGILNNEGLTLSDIVRQWNYVPNILSIEQTQGKTCQHYQVFNDVRKHWYGNAQFTEGYPAATGIGVKTGPFSIDFVAITSSPSVRKMGLHNPKQENAYRYTQQHLIGDALHGKLKNPPLFERAKLLTISDKALVIVSGTAAILGQETVGLGDVAKQTEVSINNMLELLSPAVTQQNTTFRFNYIRVYIKEAAHRDTVKAICDTYFPDVPGSYVLADVCRDNLLMEIEGEAFTCNL